MKDGKDGNRNEETKNEEKPNNVTNVQRATSTENSIRFDEEEIEFTIDSNITGKSG